MHHVKSKGRHPDKSLTAVRVRALNEPGRYADGNGLYLFVDRSGAKRWVLRTVVRGKRCDIGLGGVALVSLAEAREQASALRKIARIGGDPLAERRAARIVVPTFEQAARQVHAERLKTWKNSKHQAQWINTLSHYVFADLGGRSVDKIDTPDILSVLSPIWLAKPETARRVRQRIGTVLDWAKAAGFRSGDNAVDGVSKGLPKQPQKARHHTALSYADVPDFVVRLREAEGSPFVRLAFEFLILTATRTSDVLGAAWIEINTAEGSWTIPASRMKVEREHRVPLSTRCIDIIAQAQTMATDDELVFPSHSPGKRLSNMVFLMTLRRMGLKITAHGFRSSFRDWSSERTSFPRDVCEMALAHTIRDKTEAAYRRGDLFDKRRELMEAWARFAAPTQTNIIDLSSKRDASPAKG